jgi:proteic killer suppression protein
MRYNNRVIVSFANRGTEDIFDGTSTKAARNTCPQMLWKVAHRKLDALNQAAVLGDLRVPPGNRLEALKGDRDSQHSIRINEQYRVCFRWTGEGPAEVEITDYH